MAVRRFEPFRDFLERFFEEDFFPIKPYSVGATDVYETDKDIVVEVAVPGFEKENIKISFQGNYLKVEGQVEEKEEEKKENYWRQEIRKGSFSRVIPLPKEVDSKKAKANLKDGVLKIVLPKKEVEPSEEIKIE